MVGTLQLLTPSYFPSRLVLIPYPGLSDLARSVGFIRPRFFLYSNRAIRKPGVRGLARSNARIATRVNRSGTVAGARMGVSEIDLLL